MKATKNEDKLPLKIRRVEELYDGSYTRKLWLGSDEHIFIYGESRLQLKEIIANLMDSSLLDVEGEEPQMVYFKTIKTALRKEYLYKKKKKFADISIKFEPQELGAGYKFVDETKGGVVPKEFIYPIN